MANAALAHLEDALRTRKLDRTLTTALPSMERMDAAALVATGIPALDRCLQGGLPRGQLSEIAGPRSSGRLTALTQMLAAATRRGEIAAFIDTCDRLDVASVVAAGVDLNQLLWVRGDSISTGAGGTRGPGMQAEDRLVDRALKALNLVLQARGFGLVAIDLADVPLAALNRIPFTTWPRVQRTIEGSDTACVLLVPHPLARSAGGLTLTLAGATRWAGDAVRSHRIDGLDIDVRIVSPRRRVQGEVRVCGSALG
jgi:hypothetical protein